MPEDKGPQKLTRAQREENVLAFWKENDIFKKTLEKEAPEGDFVFFEGPPTANGKPALHHLEARVFKDAIPRYKTMRGFHVPRKAGWDTHGLPVELQIEKKLGLTSKKDIEKYGVEKFNAECKQSVFDYIGDWERFSDRIGYWVDQEDAYYTFDNAYIQAVWSVMAKVEERKLLYKDYKVLPWCPRCGTGLSSHELAQPGAYQNDKDLSVYAKFKMVDFPSAYFLAWTTTPWTLPGNVALAVGAGITYVEAKVGEETYVLAKERLSLLTEPYEILAEHKGSEMIGMSYEPLYPYLSDNLPASEKGKLEKAFKIYAADFVNTEDGTGIVHTAVMYGQDDFELGSEIGLPKMHLVDDSGHFLPMVEKFAGRFVKDEETSVEIIKDLAHRGLLFRKEKHEHMYPHCWRCKTPLIYYARDSWYIRMSSLRDELVAENEKVNWEPDYFKEGRFGDWLREIKDWAISRERYWGTPLPVWIAAGGDRIVADSVETLKKFSKKSGNRYFVMRHGEADSNVSGILNGDKGSSIKLVEAGREKAKASAEALKGAGITKIFSSQFGRTLETANIAKDTLGLAANINEDERLNETRFGEFDGKGRDAYRDAYRSGDIDFDKGPDGGDTLNDLRKRVGAFLYELEEKYANENILIVSHGDPLWMLDAVANGFDAAEAVSVAGKRYMQTGDVRELAFSPLPHNENFELDLHKPFIDSIVLEKDGETYTRVKEVMDVWLDSGSMPFAQDAKKRVKEGGKPGDFSHIIYPADFISEAIDQTRGWFYTLHAVGVLMERGAAFRNVICLGHILDKEGKKMSKSVGNVVDPFELIEKYGVDTLRFWMYSVNQPGESKNFDEQTVQETERKVFNLIDNVCAFYELYRDKALEESEITVESPHVLDQWIMARLAELIQEMTAALDGYKLLEPTRALRAFSDDLSTWYVRRSRERLKEGSKEAKQTLYSVLKTVSFLLAPFAPFAAEDLYQKLRTSKDALSVHERSWPEANMPDSAKEVIENMKEVRRIVSLGLEARNKVNMKIRQPLAALEVKEWNLSDDYAEIIVDEVNVKKLARNDKLEAAVLLDAVLTPELVEEGKVRELIRSIQEMRKQADLKPSDIMPYRVSEGERDLFDKYHDEIVKATNVNVSRMQ